MKPFMTFALGAAALAGAAAVPAAAAPLGTALPQTAASASPLHAVDLRPGQCTPWRIVSADCSERTCLPPGEYSTGPYIQRQCKPSFPKVAPRVDLRRRPVGPRPTF